MAAPAPAAPTTTSAPDGTHRDTTAHAANLQSFGQHHAEARLDARGNVQLHLYGLQPSELMPVAKEALLEAEILPPGEDPQPLTFTARPYPGEPDGKSSRWVAKWTETGRMNFAQANDALAWLLPCGTKGEFGASAGHPPI